MAQAVVNLTYVGQPSAPGAGTLAADQTSGPKSRTLYGYGTIVASSGTYCTETKATINFIDGIQTFGKTIVLPINSVQIDTSKYTNGADYYTVGAAGQIKVGDSVTIAGFTNSGNNLTTTVAAVTSSFITVTNSGAVTETNPAATMTDLQSAVPVSVNVFPAGGAADSTTTMASAAFWSSNVLGTSFICNHNSFVTTGATCTIGAVIAFSS